MRAEQLSGALAYLSDSLLEEARQSREHPPRVRPSWQRWGALAACVALVAVIGVGLLPSSAGPSGENPSAGSLPMLTLGDSGVAGMGFEGYMAYDIGELLDKNPWTPETSLDTLPVYRNGLTYNDQHQVQRPDFDSMEEVAVEVAVKLVPDPESLTVTDNAPDDEYRKAVTEKLAAVGEEVPEGYFDPTEVVVEGDGITVTVDATLTARIDFTPPVELPEEINFTHFATQEEKAEAAEYLSTRYSGLLSDMEKPVLDQGMADRNIYRERSFNVEYYDAGGDMEEQIINYNFNRVSFYCDDNGDLFLARVWRMVPAEKLGDYPLIGKEEAKELLLAGNYTTSVPYEMPGEEYIGKVELLYRTGSYENNFLPYYRFLVELPEDEREEDGLKTYGAYYVPAVEGRYIADMPKWDGGFNGSKKTVKPAVPPEALNGPIVGQK